MSLTSKQEKFCQNIVKGMSQYDSYVDAYDTNPKTTKRETIDNNAYETASKGEIKARIEELKAPIIKKLQYTALESFNKLKEIQAIALAEEKKDLSSAIKSEELKGKLADLYTTTTRELNPTQIVVNSDKDKTALESIKPRGK
jgi:hypothetical protein